MFDFERTPAEVETTLADPVGAPVEALSAIAAPPSVAAALGAQIARLDRGRLRRLVRYGATSAICLGLSEVTLLVLIALGVNASVAALTANLAGTLPSYLLSRYWIWADADRRRVGRQVALYWATSAAAMACTSVGTGVVAHLAPTGHLHLAFVGTGYLLISVVLWIAKFALYHWVIFPAREGEIEAALGA